MSKTQEQKGWLVLEEWKIEARIGTLTAPVVLPDDVLAMLPIYRTKTAAYRVHGRRVKLEQVRFVPSNR